MSDAFGGLKQWYIQKLLLRLARGRHGQVSSSEWMQMKCDLAVKVARLGVPAIEVLCQLLWEREGDGRLARKFRLSPVECTELRNLSEDILVGIGEPTVDIVLSHCGYPASIEKDARRELYGRILSRIGNKAIPKLISFLSQEAQRRLVSPLSMSSTDIQEPRSVVCSVLGDAGPRAVRPLVQTLIESEDPGYAQEVLNLIAAHNRKAVSEVLLESVIFFVNKLGLKPTIEFLKQFGDLAVPCRVNMFYDEHLGRHGRRPVRVLVTRALTELKATGSTVGLIYLDTLSQDYERFVDHLHSPDVEDVFRALPAPDKLEAVEAYSKKYESFLIGEVLFSRLEAALGDELLLSRLQVGLMGTVCLEGVVMGAFSKLSEQHKRAAVERFSTHYHGIVLPPESAERLRSFLQAVGLLSCLTKENVVINPECEAAWRGLNHLMHREDVGKERG